MNNIPFKNYIVKIMLLLFISISVFLVSCTSKKDAKKLVGVHSTIVINKKDTKETIIEKAAHVVPTENQYAALQNEFIAFIHFGPNSFSKVEWGD
ncbi:MAG: hypothetical protein ACWIPI_06295, partial [Polaribacter sp.]